MRDGQRVDMRAEGPGPCPGPRKVTGQVWSKCERAKCQRLAPGLGLSI